MPPTNPALKQTKQIKTFESTQIISSFSTATEFYIDMNKVYIVSNETWVGFCDSNYSNIVRQTSCTRDFHSLKFPVTQFESTRWAETVAQRV